MSRLVWDVTLLVFVTYCPMSDRDPTGVAPTCARSSVGKYEAAR